MFEELITERKSRFQVLDRIKSRLPDVPEKEVLPDVAEALSVARQIKNANVKSVQT